MDNPFEIYSPTKIVSSSRPVRDRVNQIKVQANDLDEQIKNFEIDTSTNNQILSKYLI